MAIKTEDEALRVMEVLNAQKSALRKLFESSSVDQEYYQKQMEKFAKREAEIAEWAEENLKGV